MQIKDHKESETKDLPRFAEISQTLSWNRSSYVILSLFLLTVIMIIYFWWPLAEMVISYIDWSGEWWRYFDWLLVGIFLFMTLVIMSGADLKRDAWIILVGAAGGLVIEAWGTQTSLWTYFTDQRPPLWIIPAWPIASLTIDRVVTWLNRIFPEDRDGWIFVYKTMYWIIFLSFAILMIFFIWSYIGQSMTIMACLLVVLVIITPLNYRTAIMIFMAGSVLGYFLEYWGTTRECWTYYTLQTPPLFAVLAHGMAGLVFWRTWHVLSMFAWKIFHSRKMIIQQTMDPSN